MSLNAHALRLLAEKGLTAADIVELAEALEVRRDPTAAERMRRMRAKKNERVTVTRNVTVEPFPNDINSNPTGFDVSNETSAVSDFAAEVVEAWGREIAGTPLPAAHKLSADRRKHLNARVKDHGRAAVFIAMRGMCRSDFHSGKSGQWTHGNLGWLIKNDENFVKMLERGQAEAPKEDAEPWTAERRAAYLAKLEARTAEPAPKPPPDVPRQGSGPRPLGQIVQRIQDQAA
jgi:hypothetical protein